MGKPFKNFSLSTFADLESKLRAGQMDPVKQVLEEIGNQRLARPLIVKVASLARRVGYQRYALRLLSPIVRPKKPIVPPASEEEQVEYAVNLVRISVVKEAYKILSSVDERKNPDALLFQAFCLFISWDYTQAIPLLEKYIRINSVSPYQKLVAQTNMVQGFISEVDFVNAERVIKNILSTATPEDRLIVGYTHQLYSELWINRGNVDKGLSHLELAKKFLTKTHYRYELYNRQWSAILKMLSEKTLKEGKRELTDVRYEAVQTKVWEVLRDCDLYEAILTNNPDIAVKLYFGTPHAKFRERVLKLVKKKLSLPETYAWHPMGNPLKKSHVLDVYEGIDCKSGAKLKAGHLVHKLLQVLASDFYRPFKLQALFGLLFPDEYYNIVSSAHKVHDLIGRLREWFRIHRIPLEVARSERGEFQLRALKPYTIKVKVFSGLVEPVVYFSRLLKTEFPDESFTIQDVIRVTGYSRAQAKLILQEAVASGHIFMGGIGRATRYSLGTRSPFLPE